MDEKTKPNYSRLKIFLGLTFIITWTSWWILAYLIQKEKLLFEDILAQLLLIIGGSAPTWVAYIAVGQTKKQADIAEFNQRAFKTKISFKFYLFAFLMPLLVGLIGIISSILTNSEFLNEYPLEPIFAFFPFFLSGIIFGGLEEFGWRGILQHELNPNINIHLKNFIIAMIWAFWHLPFFFIDGLNHYGASFLAFTLGAIGFSSLMTYLYEKTKSIFICVLFHATINAVSGIGLSVPLIETDFYILMSIIAIIMGHALLQRQEKKNSEH